MQLPEPFLHLDFRHQIPISTSFCLLAEQYYFASPDPDRFPDDDALSSGEGSLCWFRTEDICDLPMPHSARAVLAHWFREGRHTDVLYGGIAVPEGVRFTELTRF